MNNDGDVQFADRIIEEVDWSEFDVVAGVNALCRKAAEVSESKGFTAVSLPEAIALMHSELSEALEESRSGRFRRFRLQKRLRLSHAQQLQFLT